MNILGIVWDPSIGIPIGGFTIRYYSLMYLFAFVFSFYMLKNIFKRERVNEQFLDPLLMYALIGMFVGMRLGEVVFYNWDYYNDHLVEILLPIRENAQAYLIHLFGNSFIKGWEFTGFSGLASHGATVGFFIAFALFWKKYLKPLGKRFFWIYDRAVIPVALGGAMVRLGNFINSEMIGKPADESLPWATKFVQASAGSYGIDAATVFRHPAQLYEAIGYILVFALLSYIYYKTSYRKYSGFIFGLFFMLLWMVRLIVEYFKVAQISSREDWFLGLNTGQVLSIPFIIIGLIVFFTSFQRKDAL